MRGPSSGSPPPPTHYNFDTIPTVTHRDEFWHRKYAEDERARVAVPAGASEDHDADGRARRAHPHARSVVLAVDHDARVLALRPTAWCSGQLLADRLGSSGWSIGMYGWIIEPLAEGDDDDPDDHATTGR
jgi:cytochrome c oxidase subunit I